MSSIGSIHFIAQNQAAPALEHAKNIAKEHEIAQIAPPPDEPAKIEEPGESAQTSADYEREEGYAEGRQQRGRRQGKEAASSEEASGEAEEATVFFGQIISTLADEDEETRRHLDLSV